MDKIRSCVIISNVNNFQQNENFENDCSSNDSLSSENSLKENNSDYNCDNKSNLPLKKRFGGKVENSSFDSIKKTKEYVNPWIEMQQRILCNTKECDQDLRKPEPRKATILPGVIRHTSCPDTYLAYYYNYSIK